jgi:hypothetical protein
MPQQTTSLGLLGLLLRAMAILFSASVQPVRHLFSANDTNPVLSHTCARNGTAKVHAKEETMNQNEANCSEKVEHLTHGSPNRQETLAFPSLIRPQNSKTPPPSSKPNPSIITAVPSWNIFEAPQQKMLRSAQIPKKHGRRQGAGKGRLLHMPRTQVQVRYKFYRTVK